jgi:hypothetical protein
VAIIRELVRLDLLPNYFRESSLAFALVDEVRATTAAVSWKGIAAATDLKVLQSLFEIVRPCCKAVFDGSARQVGERARVDLVTASRSMRRLVAGGWLEQISRARGVRPATWRLRVPSDRTDRSATIRHAEGAGNGLLKIDPCFARGDRADLIRSAPSFDHDLFRCGKGLGPIKGRIYSLLAVSMTPREIAKTLAYKYTRNVTLHLQVLAREGLVRRRDDGRYERSDVDLDAIAARLGVLGAREKQRARHRAERAEWCRWYNAFVHWRQTGEIIDPKTGEILEIQDIPGKRARMRAFRYRVLSIRARRVEVREARLQSASEPCDLAREVIRVVRKTLGRKCEEARPIGASAS